MRNRCLKVGRSLWGIAVYGKMDRVLWRIGPYLNLNRGLYYQPAHRGLSKMHQGPMPPGAYTYSYGGLYTGVYGRFGEGSMRGPYGVSDRCLGVDF